MTKNSIKRILMKLIPVLVISSVLPGNAFGTNSPGSDALRISAWYWLNSIEKEKWEQDFQSAAGAGFTDLILCWGLDSAAVLSQEENTRRALDLCKKHGLGAYLFVWHPTHNSLPRQARFQQVDNRGNRLFTFNLFHQGWRRTQWKTYLQEVAKAYKDHPALAGYLLDDTFQTGPVGSFGGAKSQVAGDFVSYSSYDFDQFRQWLRKKYSTLPKLRSAWASHVRDWESVVPPREITPGNEAAWEDWCDARSEWLREWAGETARFIREVDSSSDHEIYLEDTQQVLGLEQRNSKDSFRPVTVRDTVGLRFGAVARYFDAVCGYTYFRWDTPDALAQALETTKRTLQSTRSQVGGRKKIIYTFWVSDADLNKPLPLRYPDAQQIIAITKAALALGVRHVDYYAFRVGDARVDEGNWEKLRPGSGITYPLTKPLSGRHLCDRPEVLKALAERHRELKVKYR
jgi:Beta-galactosidase